jgi:hypothetical protein
VFPAAISPAFLPSGGSHGIVEEGRSANRRADVYIVGLGPSSCVCSSSKSGGGARVCSPSLVVEPGLVGGWSSAMCVSGQRRRGEEVVVVAE